MATTAATRAAPETPAGPAAPESLRWTISDLEMLPEPLDDKRYEIIDGELCVSTQPHWRHQSTCNKVQYFLEDWSQRTGAGVVIPVPGVIFAEDEAVAPDVVWISRDRVPLVVADDGKLHAAPDLVLEVLSPGSTHEARDRDKKLRLYSRRGVQEYWIANWQRRTFDVFRRKDAALRHVATLTDADTLDSPLLPGFSCSVARFFVTLPQSE